MKKGLSLSLFLLLLVQAGKAEISSLSQLFAPGQTIQDLDGDGYGEKISLSIVIPDDPSAEELALAADIAARANLESLSQDFALVLRESEVENWESLPNPILVGAGVKWAREIARDRRIDVERMGPDRGLVFVFSHKGRTGIACVAATPDALLRTGRAYFLRWPYFWEIRGRETGDTYLSFEADLGKFLGQENVDLQRTAVREATYGFPPAASARGALKNLSFASGEIEDLVVEINFIDEEDQEKAFRALELLAKQRPRGLRSAVLSYAGCARITFELRYGKKSLKSVLPRLGSSARLLTPPFKEGAPVYDGAREFDLLNVFTAKGLYSDRDGDGILDGLESRIVIPANFKSREISGLASKLVLPTAGASFPLVYLDSEIENGKTLSAPVLVGPNLLSEDLVRKGKLKLPAMDSAWGVVQVVPKAFNDSSALVVHSPDKPGLEKVLAYLAETFPYFTDYRQGNPRLEDIRADFAKFLKGEKGSAEAYFLNRLESLISELGDADLESLEVRFALPRENRLFSENVSSRLGAALKVPSLSVEAVGMKDGRTIFEKEKDFSWEGDDALARLREGIQAAAGAGPVKVSLGVSESPAVRQDLKKRAEQILAESNLAGSEVEVLSAYKQGFFWITETILPQLRTKGVHRILIRCVEDKDPRTVLKRSYAEPHRWLQELYPVDDILARELAMPLERIEFEIASGGEGPVYEFQAFDEKNAQILKQVFSPRTREIPFLDVLPEWGRAKITTGWIKVDGPKGSLLNSDVSTDLEKIWAFYQDEVLRPVYAHILKKTGAAPTFSKQPYFKRLLIECWASEPDYRIGLDEEIVSSLEAVHDEIYFDTLDFIRGITRFDSGDSLMPEDTSRSSAPGNVMPLIHQSVEGKPGRVRVAFEDWSALVPEMEVRWKEKDREPASRKFAFPEIKMKTPRIPALIFNGQEGRLETVVLETEADKEADYSTLLDILESYRNLLAKGCVVDPFSYPGLRSITARLRWQNLEKDEAFPIAFKPAEEVSSPPIPGPEEAIVPTGEIISPEKCLEIVSRLAAFRGVRTFTGGTSFEGRPVPVVEVFFPADRYVSIARLITFKPALQLSARQHGNEVSSTNYALKLVELLARDRTFQDYARKINYVIQPMENPDGAALAGELARIAPFHSLHAGRYGSLGVDIGYQATAASAPVLPEAAVRTGLYDRWLPDIYLNLHGYPSHEWVQPFSNYTPFLFRDYRIPKGWFAYAKSPNLSIYDPWKTAEGDLLGFVSRELQADERFKESNAKFYDRYNRWIVRWQPHLGRIELHDGVNLYARRDSNQENRLTARSRATFMDGLPEVMDETATGDWLDFLCAQGLAYLKGHIKYLSQVRFETARIEEEVRERVRIEFHRSRPGTVPEAK